MTDREARIKVLMDAGIDCKMAEAMADGSLAMERMERKRVCVNYVEWLCADGKCESCRSYAKEFGGEDLVQLKLDLDE